MGRNGKKGANQHNAKHENGIVAPGKRVTKQNANGHLGNGSIDASIGSSATIPGRDAAGAVSIVLPIQHSSHQDASESPTGAAPRSSPVPKLVSHQSQSDSVSDDLEEPDTLPVKINQQEHKGRILDVSTAKQTVAHDASGLRLALTVIASATTADIMAILVLLLSVPSAFLHAINISFAVLTFQPPSGSFTTLPSLSDITSSFSPGTPSVVVLVLLDLMAICLWSVIPWPHLQTILLDCASAQIATHVGGGHASSPASTNHLLYSAIFVVLTHLGHYRQSILKWLHKTPLAKHLPLAESLDDLPLRSSYMLNSDRSWLDTVKIWVALHILTSGLTTVVRKALDVPKESSLGNRNVDPEANNNSAPTENIEIHTPSSPSALKSKASLQNLRELKDRISIGKKRKKQANLARSQQPLWAALASYRINWVRGYAQSKAAKEAKADQTAGARDLGSAPFAKQDNKIWISGVFSDKVYFETGPMPCPDAHGINKLENEAGVTLSAPFVVRVNGATWASIRLLPLLEEENVEGKTRWIGEIYGLSAAHTYKVSWISEESDFQLHFEIIFTPSSLTDQADSSNTVQPRTLRPPSPASPIATVQAAIANYEASVNELHATRKRNRKESKAAIAKIERETEMLNEKYARSVAATKALSQRQTQLENSIKQMDDAAALTDKQIADLDSTSEAIISEWQEEKIKWEATRNELSRVQEDVQRTKEENRASLTTLQTKELSERQKRDRLQTRKKKLATDLANLQGSSGDTYHHRANSTYVHRAAELDQIEAQAQLQLDSWRHKCLEIVHEAQNMRREADHLEHIAYQNDAFVANQNEARFAHDSRPLTPEGDLPGTNPPASGSNQSAAFARPLMFQGTPEMVNAIPVTTSSKAFANGFASSSRHNSVSARHRSQSGLSGNSVYAEHGPDIEDEDEDDDEDPIPLMHKRRTGGLSGSDGRSSGSGSPHVNAGAIPPPPIGSERRHSPAQAGSS